MSAGMLPTRTHALTIPVAMSTSTLLSPRAEKAPGCRRDALSTRLFGPVYPGQEHGQPGRPPSQTPAARRWITATPPCTRNSIPSAAAACPDQPWDPSRPPASEAPISRRLVLGVPWSWRLLKSNTPPSTTARSRRKSQTRPVVAVRKGRSSSQGGAVTRECWVTSASCSHNPTPVLTRAHQAPASDAQQEAVNVRPGRPVPLTGLAKAGRATRSAKCNCPPGQWQPPDG